MNGLRRFRQRGSSQSRSARSSATATTSASSMTSLPTRRPAPFPAPGGTKSTTARSPQCTRSLTPVRSPNRCGTRSGPAARELVSRVSIPGIGSTGLAGWLPARPFLQVRVTRNGGGTTAASGSRVPRPAAGSASLAGARARWPGRCREDGPHGFSQVAERRVAPVVAESADEVQPAASFGEGTGIFEHRRFSAGVGDRAQHARPRPGQAELDDPVRPGRAGSWQGVTQRIGQQLRHHDRDVAGAFRPTPPLHGGDSKIPGCWDRCGICARRADGHLRETGPLPGCRISRQRPVPAGQGRGFHGRQQPAAPPAATRVAGRAR
jgi:hypothetical protein